MSDQIEVQGAWVVILAAHATERHLHAREKSHHLLRPQPRLDKRDPVEIVRIRRVGPGGRTPPAG